MGRVTEALADATGRSDEEMRLALTALAVVATLVAGLRFLEWLSELGTDLVRHTRAAGGPRGG
jgi:hypothetical protein